MQLGRLGETPLVVQSVKRPGNSLMLSSVVVMRFMTSGTSHILKPWKCLGIYDTWVCILSVPALLRSYGVRVFAQLLSLIASLTLAYGAGPMLLI